MRRVPVKQRGKGGNSVMPQAITQAHIEINPLFVDCPTTIRNDSRPSNTKAIMLDAQLYHQLHIFFIEMVVVTSNGTCIAVKDSSGGGAKGIPHARFATP